MMSTGLNTAGIHTEAYRLMILLVIANLPNYYTQVWMIGNQRRIAVVLGWIQLEYTQKHTD
jgi:Na+-transporting NADH:ubiquinone oxidoreductase subunit NqrB